MAVTESNEWQSEHPEYEDAPKYPLELADQLSPDARASLIAEAIDHYWGGWPNRRVWFIGDLDRQEAEWFD